MVEKKVCALIAEHTSKKIEEISKTEKLFGAKKKQLDKKFTFTCDIVLWFSALIAHGLMSSRMTNAA